jgi:hypothetical protein
MVTTLIACSLLIVAQPDSLNKMTQPPPVAGILDDTDTVANPFRLPTRSTIHRQPSQRQAELATLLRRLKPIPRVPDGEGPAQNGRIPGTMSFEDVSIFHDDARFLWPGAILDSAEFIDGNHFREINVSRAPGTLVVSGLFSTKQTPESAPVPGAPIPHVFSIDVAQPTFANSTDAVHAVLLRHQLQPPATRAQVFVHDFQSIEEALVHVGVSASYLGASVKASIDTSSYHENNNFLVTVLQPYFTVDFVYPGDAGQFFAKDAEVHDPAVFGTQDSIYLATITYGRMHMFTATSRLDKSTFKAAVSTSASLGPVSGGVEASVSNSKLARDSEFRLLSLGGNTEASARFFGADKLQGVVAALQDGKTFAAAVPIRYVFRKVVGGDIVSIPLKYTKPESRIGMINSLEVWFYTETDDKDQSDLAVVSVRNPQQELIGFAKGGPEKYPDQSGPVIVSVPIDGNLRESDKAQVVIEKDSTENGDRDWVFGVSIYAVLADGRKKLLYDRPEAKKLGGDTRRQTITLN